MDFIQFSIQNKHSLIPMQFLYQTITWFFNTVTAFLYFHSQNSSLISSLAKQSPRCQWICLSEAMGLSEFIGTYLAIESDKAKQSFLSRRSKKSIDHLFASVDALYQTKQCCEQWCEETENKGMWNVLRHLVPWCRCKQHGLRGGAK